VPRVGSRFYGLVATAGFVFFLGFLPSAIAATIYVPDDYPTIQAAVDAATSGDTIVVRAGTYVENIVVDKSLTIRSERGSANTKVIAASSSAPVFKLTANSTVVQGFTVEGSMGIYVYRADKCTVSDNVCQGDNSGTGIRIYEGSQNIIRNNTCTNKFYGISLNYYSAGNEISSNCCSQNTVGISIGQNCSNNFILSNDCSNNGASGIDLWGRSDNNTVKWNNCSGNKSGISIETCLDSVIDGNTCSDNSYYGIEIRNSPATTISNNICSVTI